MDKYLRTWNRESYLDTRQLAGDLAPLLGGKVLAKAADDDMQSPVYESAIIELPGGLQIHVCTSWRDRVSKWVFRTGVDWRITGKLNGHYRGVNFPSANISASKTVERIAADIKRRLVEPSQAPLAEIMKNFADLQADTQEIAARMADLSTRFPWLTVRAEKDGTEIELYVNSGGSYLSARLSRSGTLYLDRSCSVAGSQIDALLAVFAPPN
jgi:hypothetical protein